MYRVLVADDEPIERTVVSRTIQKYFPEQAEVILAVNGREAVELFFEKKCQVALLDIEMPGVNGLEAAERIRERDRECSIIFLTAFDEFSYAKKAISIKALDYLLKPGVDEELVAALEEAFRLAEESGGRNPGAQRGMNQEVADGQRKTGQETADGRREMNQEASGGQRETEQEASDGQRRTGMADEVWEPGGEHMPENLRMNAVTASIRNYIDANYMEDISLQTAASAMNYSDAYFCKIFKQCFDKSFIVYLSEYRVERAKELLADIVINVKDISQKVGYRDSNYFAKVFKRVTGVTPTEYRMQILREAEK